MMVRQLWWALLLLGMTADCGGGLGLTPRDAGSRDPVLADNDFGRVLAAWSLDGGTFRAEPPLGDAKPAVSEARAVSIARADDPELHASQSGVPPRAGIETLVAAFGRVTISGVDGAGGQAGYVVRPAWLVAVSRKPIRCPDYAEQALPSSPPPFPPNDFFHTIFVLDATTGGDVTEYDEPTSSCSPAHSAAVAEPVSPTSFP